ncbi:hypothetical protein [uncultured Methanomethylovorans sp.]|uniref:hypothetical protein n=1 Tax=uncultured Methanomethylovorans sp. TaxID=183759 RepID=UPI002601F15C|nr:hypothetical protein [uncultured Methanomethylovorans sp.]
MGLAERGPMNCTWINGKAGPNEVFKVRKALFVEEQKVPEFLERDEFDDHAQHLQVYDNDIPIEVWSSEDL